MNRVYLYELYYNIGKSRKLTILTLFNDVLELFMSKCYGYRTIASSQGRDKNLEK